MPSGMGSICSSGEWERINHEKSLEEVSNRSNKSKCPEWGKWKTGKKYQAWALYILASVCYRRGDRAHCEWCPHPMPRGELVVIFGQASVTPSCLSDSPLLRYIWEKEQQCPWWIIGIFCFTKLTFESGHIDDVPFRTLLRYPKDFETKKGAMFLILAVVYKNIQLTLPS